MDIQTLNLRNCQNSSIKYQIVVFNDGEPHLTITSEINRKYPVRIICSIRNATDLFILMQAGDILNRHAVEFELHILYLMGARMDRVISFNEPYSLRIVADLINSLKASKVYIVEPHSNKSLSLINNSVAISPLTLFGLQIMNDGDCVVFPDAGAAERYSKMLHTESICICEKVRDLENKGKIVGFKLLNPEKLQNGKPITIIDDLCDGGGTFLAAKKEICKICPDSELRIFITHMVNQNGEFLLSQEFDKVYFTNSYCDWESYGNITVFNLTK